MANEYSNCWGIIEETCGKSIRFCRFFTLERDCMDINEWLIELTGNIDGFMYTYILLILLVVTGVYFTRSGTKCVQIRYLKDMFRQVTEKKHVDGESLFLLPGAYGFYREPCWHR